MTWRCSGCGETHEAAFVSCWRCGAKRALAPAVLAEDDEETPVEAEQATVDSEFERRQAVIAYQEAAGWYGPIGDRATKAGMALHRLVVAYRLYRERQHGGTRRARPDLDRLWTQFFLAFAVPGGLFLSVQMNSPWLAYLAPGGTAFLLLHIAAVGLCMAAGHRVVRRELDAAAETAVEDGRDKP